MCFQKAHLEIYEIEKLSGSYHQVSADAFIPKKKKKKKKILEGIWYRTSLTIALSYSFIFCHFIFSFHVSLFSIWKGIMAALNIFPTSVMDLYS